MKLAETNYDNKETGCCARLDEARWDNQEFVWKEKPFVKDHIREFLHVPLNFGSVMVRDHAAVEGALAYAAEPLWLVDEDPPGVPTFTLPPTASCQICRWNICRALL